MISTDFENFRTELKTVYQAKKAILDVVEEYLDLIGNSEEFEKLALLDDLKRVAFTGLSSDLTNDAGFITQTQVPVYTAGDGIDITSDVISLAYLKVVNGAVNIVFDDGN